MHPSMNIHHKLKTVNYNPKQKSCDALLKIKTAVCHLFWTELKCPLSLPVHILKRGKSRSVPAQGEEAAVVALQSVSAGVG